MTAAERCKRHDWRGSNTCRACGWTKGRETRRRANEASYARGYAAGERNAIMETFYRMGHAEALVQERPARERLVETLAAYRSDPLDSDDRPESWQALDALLDACDAMVKEPAL